jgi:hypothetical protein
MNCRCSTNSLLAFSSTEQFAEDLATKSLDMDAGNGNRPSPLPQQIQNRQNLRQRGVHEDQPEVHRQRLPEHLAEVHQVQIREDAR